MRERLVLIGLLAACGCNPSAVKEGDGLYDYVGGWYYLATPLSGPRFRYSNMFGQRPVLDAGTKVRVLAVERAAKNYHSDWLVSADETRTLEPVESLRIYRIYFDGPEVCRPRPCEAHWRLSDDVAFKARFEGLFVDKSPLTGVPVERLTLIKAHRVASWMTPDEVLLAFGEPNFVISSVGVERWVFEERVCDARMRLLGIPKLELVFREMELVSYETLAANDFYVVLEPRGNQSVCYDPRLDQGPTVVSIGASGAPVDLTWGPGGAEQFSRLPLERQLGIINRTLQGRSRGHPSE